MKKLPYLLLLIILSGCDLFEDAKVIVPNKNREPVVTLRRDVTPDPQLSGHPVNVSAPQVLTNWSQVGGNSSHALPNLLLGNNLVEKWHISIGDGSCDDCRLIANVVTGSGHVYAMDAVGRVVAVDALSGKIMWEHDTTPEDLPGQALGGGIAYSNGYVFAATSFGEMVAMNAKTGKILWRKELGAPMRIAPTVFGANLYIININNELLCISPENGEVKWRHSSIREATGILGAANPAVAGGMIVAGFSSGEVRALNLQSGFLTWNDVITPPTHIDTVSSIADIRARPVISGNTVYIISHAGRTTAYDLDTGYRRWTRNFGGIRTPAVSNGNLFMVTNQQELICIKGSTGQIRWSVKLPQLDSEKVLWAGPVLTSRGLALAGSNGFIIFVDPRSGKIMHRVEVGEPIALSPVVANKTMYILSESGTLFAYQ